MSTLKNLSLPSPTCFLNADSQSTSKHLKHRDMKWHEGNDDLMIAMIGWFPRASLQAAAVWCAMAESDPENSANENSQSDWEATVTEESEAQRPFNPMQQMHILLWWFYMFYGCFLISVCVCDLCVHISYTIFILFSHFPRSNLNACFLPAMMGRLNSVSKNDA